MESLLTKCKESIKANKQKTQALTETKENLASTLGEKEQEIQTLRGKISEFEAFKKKAQAEEIQIAETKMVMHQVSWWWARWHAHLVFLITARFSVCTRTHALVT